MKTYMIALPIFAGLLSSCSMINMVNESTNAIHRNREAVEMSTAAIESNIETIQRSNQAIEENIRKLREINDSMSNAQAS